MPGMWAAGGETNNWKGRVALHHAVVEDDVAYGNWRDGGLMGTEPEQGFYVRCDRTTMSQSALDNGRLIALIGVAPTKPAEFITLQIVRQTADAMI